MECFFSKINVLSVSASTNQVSHELEQLHRNHYLLVVALTLPTFFHEPYYAYQCPPILDRLQGLNMATALLEASVVRQQIHHLLNQNRQRHVVGPNQSFPYTKDFDKRCSIYCDIKIASSTVKSATLSVGDIWRCL